LRKRRDKIPAGTVEGGERKPLMSSSISVGVQLAVAIYSRVSLFALVAE
jgi:hypothetical protein